MGATNRVLKPRTLTQGNARHDWLWILLPTAIVGMLVCGLAKSAEPPSAAQDPYHIQPVPSDLRGTQQHPLVVGKAADELAVERVDQEEHSTNERRSTNATIVLSIFTILLWGANVWLICDARRVSDRQASDTRDALREQTRAADEMHAVAEATKNNAILMSGMLQKQMRAYISVEVGTAAFQNQRLRFEAMPTLTNNGLTPARNVCFKILSDILDGREIGGPIVFAEIGELIINDMGIAPRQSLTIRRVVANRVPDADVAVIMEGNSRRLFAWGKVTYDDVFGGSWETSFCLSYWFVKIGDEWKVFGNFYPKHNNST